MVKTLFAPAAPQDLRSVGGFLGERFRANLDGRLKDLLFSEEFIRLHEHKTHQILRWSKTYDEWFWLGEQIGKWLDASAYAALIAQDGALLDRVEEVVARLARSQEADGYLGITVRSHRTPVRGMELYEMYYVLHGLLVCADLFGSQVALDTARRLGEYIIRTWGPEPGQFPLAGRYPGNGHDGGEGTLILEPIVLLGTQTGDARFVEWGERTLGKWDEWFDTFSEPSHTCGYTQMKRFAAGEIQLDEQRENIHAHTWHMTLLGLAALYNATGKVEYRDVVTGCVDRLADEWIFLTGGMSSDERYVPRRFYHPRNDIEVCPQHTWILLLDQALRWTGNARYAAEIERDLFNHFLAAQVADGSNWSYLTPLNGRAEEPWSPNCCNAAGQRIAGRMPTYLYGLRGGAPAVLMYTESEAVLRPPSLPPVRLRQETGFPSDGKVTVHVAPERAARFPFYLRIPPYATGATVQVLDAQGAASGEPFAAAAGGYAVVEREWTPGDVVQLSMPFALTCQANDHALALVRGPLVYACFQDAQDDPVVFHRRRGLYPEDALLSVDPAHPGHTVVEEPAAAGLLGPALRVEGCLQARAPIFSSNRGNDALPGQAVQPLRLLPFVNQGAIRGEYRVFMEYTRPSG